MLLFFHFHFEPLLLLVTFVGDLIRKTISLLLAYAYTLVDESCSSRALFVVEEVSSWVFPVVVPSGIKHLALLIRVIG